MSYIRPILLLPFHILSIFSWIDDVSSIAKIKPHIYSIAYPTALTHSPSMSATNHSPFK